MIVPKIINKDKIIKLKINSYFPNVVLANLQEKNVIPTKGTQEIIADEAYDGLSKVIVEPISEEYQNIKDYFYETISDWKKMVKKTPPLKLSTTKTSCKSMFSSCPILDLDLSLFDTSKVTDMSYMFESSSATSIDLSSFNTSNVTNMYSMFKSSNVTRLELSNFDFSKVTSASTFIDSCPNLTYVDLSGLVKLNTTAISNFVCSCPKLETILMPNFTGEGLTSLTFAFFNNTSLKLLDIRSFDFSSITSAGSCLTNTPKNCLIIVKDAAAKSWIQKNFPTLTNIKTVNEL